MPYLRVIADAWEPTEYHEPFAGGAAAFFGYDWPKPHISDVNEELIAMYRGIRADPALVRRRLRALPHNRETFEIVRTSRPRSDTARAVRMLYLNRLAYGGIYRTDRQGRYNVPYSGDRTTAGIWGGARLEETAGALEHTVIAVGDFETALAEVRPGALVYCDPVYALPEPEGPSPFSRYVPDGFSWQDQRRLAEVAHELKARGALVVVSNASDERLKQLFRADLTLKFDRRAPLPKAVGRPVHEAVHIIGANGIRGKIETALRTAASV